MKVDIFTLCDNAQEYGGKLIIIGTFNSIYANKFPTLHPEFALVARVVFDESEKGIHNIEFDIKKEDEDVYILPHGETTADTTKTKGKDSIINVVVKGNNIPIKSAGTYVVTLKVDDKIWKSNLHVVEVKDMK